MQYRSLNSGRVSGSEQAGSVPHGLNRHPSRTASQLSHGVEELSGAHSVTKRVVYGSSEGVAAAFEHSDLQHTGTDQRLVRVRVGHQLFNEMRIRVIEMTHRVESGLDGGAYERDALTFGAEELEAVVVSAAESGGERVVVHKRGGECGGDDAPGIGGVGGADVSTDIPEGDAEVWIVVEVGELEDVVLGKWGCGWNDEGGSGDFDLHFGYWRFKLVVSAFGSSQFKFIVG